MGIGGGVEPEEMILMRIGNRRLSICRLLRYIIIVHCGYFYRNQRVDCYGFLQILQIQDAWI